MKALAHAALLASLLAVAPAAALAAPPSRAARLVARGERLYAVGRFRRAIALLLSARRAADDSSVRARAELYLGLCRHVLGRLAAARRHFAAAVRADASIELDAERFKPSVVRAFRAVQARYAGLIVVRVRGAAPRTVALDGGTARASPLRRHVAPGRHRVVVRAGAGWLVREVRVDAGARVVLELAPRPPERVQRARRRAPPPERVATPSERRSAPRLFTWITAGAAAASFIAATAVWLSTRADVDEFNSTGDAARYDALRDRIPGKLHATNALLGVGIALAAGSALLFFLEPRLRRAREPAAATSAISVTPTVAGLRLSGRF